MAEIKNTFFKGKMNKDLDERLIPKGEYREAQNILINDSEDSNVGAIENLLGNEKLYASIPTGAGADNQSDSEVVGYYADPLTKKILWFITNFEGDVNSEDITTMTRATSSNECKIVMLDTENDNTIYTLVSGHFLNFSKNHLITGVNLIDDLLFWTDNYNQPRKINIKKARQAPGSSNSPHYTTEDQISVAKTAPHIAPILYAQILPAAAMTLTRVIATTITGGNPTNGEYATLATTTSGNGTGAIVTIVFTSTPAIASVTVTASGSGYFPGDTLITAAFDTDKVVTITLQENDFSLLGDGTTMSKDSDIKSEFLKENFIRFSYRYRFDDGEYSIMAPFTQVIFKPLNSGRISDVNTAGDTEYDSGYSKYDVLEKGVVKHMENDYNKIMLRIPLPSYDEFKLATNSWSNDLRIKSIDILCKESDGLAVKVIDTINIVTTDSNIEEYTMKPFTTVQGTTQSDSSGQPVNTTTFDPGLLTDQLRAGMVGTWAGGGSGTISSVGPGNLITWTTVESIAADTIITFTNVTQYRYFRHAYKYEYKSEEPSRVLPEEQTTRVYDQVPVRAKAQEISGNRIIYGNFTENYNLPTEDGINYIIGTSTKGQNEYGVSGGMLQHAEKTYKFHSVKQRRQYQVGIVLADKFGRQSSVILSSNTSDVSDTFTTPIVTTDFSLPANNYNGAYSWSTLEAAIGKSLHIYFKDDESIIPSSSLYNKDTNPHGWYSWRIVVKQKEQEYYNIYAPHPADNWNNIDHIYDTSRSARSWLSLYGDNVNKIPRDATDIDAAHAGDVTGSETRLYPKVIAGDTQYDAGSYINTDSTDFVDVISLGNAKDQNLFLQATIKDTVGDNVGLTGYTVLPFVHGSERNPLVAELPNMKNITGANMTAGHRTYVYEDTATDRVLKISRTADNNISTATITTYMRVTGNDITVGSYLAGNQTSGTGTVPQDGNVYIIDAGSNLLSGHMALTLNKDAFTAAEVKKGAVVFIDKYTRGLSVFETEPFKSRLEIFYETSTGGLIEDLNLQISQVIGSPTGLAWSGNNQNPTFGEQQESGYQIGTLTSNPVTPSANMTYILNWARNTEDPASDVGIAVSSGGSVTINTEFAYFGDSTKDEFKLNITYTEAGGNSSTGEVICKVANYTPWIKGPNTCTSGCTATAFETSSNGTVFATGTAENGTALSTENKTGLTYSFVMGDTVYNNLFAVDSVVAGVYRLKTTGYWNVSAEDFAEDSAGNRTMTVTVTDGGGLTASIDIIISVNLTDNRIASSFVYQANSSGICLNSSATNYYVSKGSGDTVTANELVLGNKIWDNDWGGTQESAVGYYKFSRDGADHYVYFSGNIGSRVVSSSELTC